MPGDGEEFEGFLGSGRSGAAFRRGLILDLALTPSKREKVQCTLHLPLLQQDDEGADLDGGLYARTGKSTDSVTLSGFVERCAPRLTVLHFGFRFLK